MTGKRFLGAAMAVCSGAIALMAVTITAATAMQAGTGAEKFNQLTPAEIPDPNVYRDASGAPGPDYWQQRADYQISVTLDENAKRITGDETITYHNNAPRALRYIWVQLDQNRFREDSLEQRSESASSDVVSYARMRKQQMYSDYNYGDEIRYVTDEDGNALPYTIVDTVMRIDLPEPLESGDSYDLNIGWEYQIVDNNVFGGRNGFNHHEATDSYIYFLAQWYPRVAVFSDYEGWHTKAFLGAGEFTLEFGDFDVEITVPADHIVSSTGELQNPEDVLTETQMERLEEARDSERPVFIVTMEEAIANQAEGTDEMATWHFTAENVRDFAFASSRKFIWDAMGYHQDDEETPFVMAMSFYPQEAEPLWSKYSTEAVVHTMEVYSRFSFPYPYPTSQSVNTWASGGMEYPMITFNGYMPTKEEALDERTYSRTIKKALIGVIIHEVGHNYFPMIVNSDERQWTWMDEGLNSFLDEVGQMEWEENYPIYNTSSFVNKLDHIAGYMQSSNQVPIMTQSDSIIQFGSNAYAKPAASLFILRETVMGRELFDFAFKEYANRWMYKRPTPADFFRTMEDASGVDLDWFWRGWYFTTDHVDVAITDVREYQVSTLDPDVEFPLKREEYNEDYPEPLQQSRNREDGLVTRLERRPFLADFYNENDEFTVTNADRNQYMKTLEGLEPWERATLDRAIEEGDYIYFIDFENQGGLVSPIPLTLTYEDGSVEEYMIPAEIWRRNAYNVSKLFIRDKKLVKVEADKHHLTADADYNDNQYPQEIGATRLELYKSSNNQRNMMQKMMEDLQTAKDGEDDSPAMPMDAN